jgi:hypothetical protein
VGITDICKSKKNQKKYSINFAHKNFKWMQRNVLITQKLFFHFSYHILTQMIQTQLSSKTNLFKIVYDQISYAHQHMVISRLLLFELNIVCSLIAFLCVESGYHRRERDKLKKRCEAYISSRQTYSLCFFLWSCSQPIASIFFLSLWKDKNAANKDKRRVCVCQSICYLRRKKNISSPNLKLGDDYKRAEKKGKNIITRYSYVYDLK